tara:strand:- start:332 stop:1261 length:930 start_codon:yes stop_codon:yes gene_type:complete
VKKFLLTIFLGLLINISAFADERFEKDLKKISKLNSFVDSQGNHYKLDENIDKDKTIILIYTHGQWGGQRKINGCNRIWGKIPPVIYQLDGTQIKDLTIKTYQLCSGVKGWTQTESDKFWEAYDKNNQDVNSVLSLKDKNGILLIDKNKDFQKQKVMKLKIDEFKKKGFNNIILSGHSAGAYGSLILKSIFPEEIDGVISLHIGFGGKFAKAKNPDQGWINWRNYKKSLINWAQLGDVIFFTHDKDWADTRSTLNFLTDFENLEFFDLSDTDCKGKVRLAGYHGIALTKCFANKDIRSKEVINYLNKIY